MREQLLRRLEPVLSAPALALFRTLVDHVERFDDKSGSVVCHFPGMAPQWVISPAFPATRDTATPRGRELQRTWDKVVAFAPQRLRELLSVCATLEFGEMGDTGQVVLSNGFSGTSHADGPDIVNKDVFPFAYADTLCSSVTA
jgi:hypothetical protein